MSTSARVREEGSSRGKALECSDEGRNAEAVSGVLADEENEAAVEWYEKRFVTCIT